MAALRLFVTLSIVIASSAGTCAQTPPTSRPALIDREALAASVLRAYRTAAYLKFQMDVTSGPHRLQVEVEMAPRRLLTHVWQGGRTFAVLGMSDGVCWEYRPLWKDSGDRFIREVRVEYEAPEPNGSGNMLLGEHEDCLYGTLLRTWLGPRNEQVELIADRIRAADRIETGEAGGLACWAVTTRDEQFNGYVEQTYWFDQVSCFLRRWETRDVESGELTLRNREYSKIEVSAAAPEGAFADEVRRRSPMRRGSNLPALRTPIRIDSLPRLKPRA